MNKTMKILLYGLILVHICDVGVSCKRDSAGNSQKDNLERPISQHSWLPHGKGFGHWDCGGEYLYAQSKNRPEKHIVESWKWEGIELKKHKTVETKPSLVHAWINEDHYIFIPFEEEGKPIVVKNAITNDIIKKWIQEKGWYCNQITPSNIGKYFVVNLEENYTKPPEGYDWNKKRLKIGLIDQNFKEIKWLSLLVGSDVGHNIGKIIPSDDGAYVVVAGWNNGAVVLDVVNDKVLWEKSAIQMDHEVSLRDIAFSPDNKYIYTAGSSGCVYKVDLQNGNILSKWWTTEPGKPIYGYRINYVAVSPDGRFVAADAGPTGIVYVWETETEKIVKTLNHGSSMMMIMFSPNSQALATIGGGTIKIWEMPE